MDWQPKVLAIPIPTAKRVARLDVRVCAEDAEGQVNVTDVMLQGGVLATLWQGHPAEIRFALDP